MMQKKTLLLAFIAVSLAVTIIACLYTFLGKEGAEEFPETKRAEGLSSKSLPPQEVSEEVSEIKLPRVESTTVSYDDSAVPELQRLLNDTNDLNKLVSVAKALAEIGTSGATEALVARIINEPSNEIRTALAASLQYLRNPEAAPILTETLLTQTDDRVVASAVRDSLARVADDSAVEGMTIAYHERVQSGRQRSYLLGTLSRVRNPQTVPALRSILMNDTDSAYRLQAAISLSVMGNKEAIDSLVTTIQESPSKSSTNALVQCLGNVRNEESSSYMLDLLRESTDERVRYGAALAVTNMELDQNLSVSLEIISDSETSDRVRQVIEALLEKLNDFNSQEDQ